MKPSRKRRTQDEQQNTKRWPSYFLTSGNLPYLIHIMGCFFNSNACVQSQPPPRIEVPRSQQTMKSLPVRPPRKQGSSLGYDCKQEEAPSNYTIYNLYNFVHKQNLWTTYPMTLNISQHTRCSLSAEFP